MMNQVDKLVKAFKVAAQNSSPVSAAILNLSGSIVSIITTWSQRNLERKITMQFQYTQTVNLDSGEVNNLGSVETTSEFLSTYSPSGTRRGLIREVAASGKNPKKQFLEIWQQNRLQKAIDLTALEVHGDVYTDSEFGTFQWSESEEMVLYIAEKKVSKSEPFISIKSPSKKSEDTTKGGEYLFIEDWGESLVGKSCPVVVVCNIKEEEVKVLEGPPEDLSLGQVVWAPDGGVVGVAWETNPRRLGLVYCTNRPSWIFHLSPTGIFRKLSNDGLSVRSPQFSPNKESLLWLERPAGGPHHACQRLIKYCWKSQEMITVIDIVEESTKLSDGEPFYGLYNMLLNKCWLSDNRNIVLSTQQRGSVKTYLIDTESKIISQIAGSKSEDFSQGVLDVKDDVVICWKSSLLMAPGLVAAKVNPDCPVQWIPVVEPRCLEIDYELDVFHLEAPSSSDSFLNFTALYFGPKTGSGVPLIVWPHGGPHSAFTNSYSLMASFFATLGFGMVMVNYRGSTGHGQAGVQFLLGKVGTTDVADMHQAALHVLQTKPNLASDKCVLFGGSHGGFLVLHLSGQYPKQYKSCVALNPVVDLPVFSCSDIPDWAIVEAGYEYTPTTELTPEMFEKMHKASPINFAPCVEAPTLLLLGKKDLRVPCYQGLLYYHALRARNIKAKVLLYDDSHPLSQTMHEADFAMNTAIWFLENIDFEIAD